MAGSAATARQAFGNHLWQPDVQADWSRGMVRDTARDQIPAGGVYDACDFLLHQTGMAQKRGGSSYLGPVMTAATYACSVVYAVYASGAQVLAVGENGHLYTVTSGTTTDVSSLGAVFNSRHKPVVVPSSGAIIAVFFANDGTTAPKRWTGAAAATLGGTPPTALMGAYYKQRLVLANSLANPNRIWFSPVPSVESTWDTANSYIDTEQAVSGLAALNNTLLVFHRGSTERIIGATPPPNSDMDKAKIWDIGCTDARSIVVQDGNCLFANPRGVYLTNGSTPVSLTQQGGINNYWRSLFPGYDPVTWSIACGVTQQFLFVTVQTDAGVNVAQLLCHVPTRAWMRLSNIRAMMFANAGESYDDLYYADRTAARVVTLAQVFDPATGNRNDADGTAVLPTIEFAPSGPGVGVNSYGFGRLDYDMPGASTSPTLGITVKAGLQAERTSWVPAESPLAETTAITRKRFSICRDAQAVTVSLAQSVASDRTEVYALEVERRARTLVGEGVS